ncbi:MAG: LysR substrate-binding domain-containing protein [Actinomycetota bacterium]
MIDVRRLHVLRAAAAYGSFSKAAAALLLTPSAVSQQVAALERSTGFALVERSTRGVRLTEAGEILVAAADTIAAEVRHAENQLVALASGNAGRLRVATFATASQRLLPPALARMTRAHPDAELLVVEAEPPDSVPMLLAGQADVAVVYAFPDSRLRPPAKRDSRLRWTTLLDDTLHAVLPIDHPRARARRVDIADLADDPWVQGLADSGEVLEQLAARAGFELKVSCTSSNYQFIQAMVAAGIGIALVPETALARDIKGVVAVPLSGARPFRRISAVTVRRRRSPLVDELLVLLGQASAGRKF